MTPPASPTLVTFDYEGQWGMPHDAPYDIADATTLLLDMLARHGVSAMFFVVGRLVTESPDLVSRIASAGHGIGLHGLCHEHLELVTPRARRALRDGLERACAAVETLTGSRPDAFRAPYLLGPRFSDPATSEMLVELGFRWTSNREVRFAEELFRPDRVPSARARRLAATLGLLDARRPLGSTALVALNAPHLAREQALGSAGERLRWLLAGQPPFERSGLVEVAVSAPLDCDLVGTPPPGQDTPESLLDYAARSLSAGAGRRASPYVLTFHDWIVASANRPRLLDRVLGELGAGRGFEDGRSWRPRAAATVA